MHTTCVMKFLNEFSLDINQGNEQKINKRLFGLRERERERDMCIENWVFTPTVINLSLPTLLPTQFFMIIPSTLSLIIISFINLFSLTVIMYSLFPSQIKTPNVFPRGFTSISMSFCILHSWLSLCGNVRKSLDWGFFYIYFGSCY